MDDKQIQDELDRLKSVSESYRHIIEENLKRLEKEGKSIEEANKTTLRFVKSVEDASKRFKKSAEEISVSIDGLKKRYKEQDVTAEELEESLNALRKQIEYTTDQTKKASLIRAKTELENANARNKATEIFKDSMGQLAGVAIAGTIKSFTGAAKSALSGGDALKVAGDFMSSQIDMANGATQVGSKALSDFGAVTAGAGGKLKYVGIAASAAGAGLGFLGNQVSELAKAGIGFMIGQTQKLISGFQQLSAAGAIFAGGMKEMSDVALSANMTLEQFAKVVGENREQLASTGMSVGQASRKMAAAMEFGGKSARDSMFALGMSIEEQGDAFAKTMSLMAGPSGQLRASNAEVAAQTQDYAKNLKLISDITGQDAKARIEKLRRDNDTLAFNSYLNGLDEKERLRTQQAMSLMSDEDQRAFREKKLYGNVISQDLAISRATNSGIRKAQDEIFEQSERHALDVKGVAQTYQRNQKEVLDQSNKSGKTLGLVMTGAGADAAKAMNSTTQHINKFGDAMKTSELVEAASKPGGKEEVALQNVQQDFAVQMQQIARNNLPEFSKALITTIGQIKSSVAELAKMSVGAGTSASTFGTAAQYLGGAASLAQIGMGGKGAYDYYKSKGVGTGGGLANASNKFTSKLASNGKVGIGGLVGGIALDYAADKLNESGHEKLGATASIGSSALAGAGMGALLGPMGAAVGGALGAGYGLYKNWGNLTGSPKAPGATAGIGSPDMGSMEPMAVAKEAMTQQIEMNDLLKKQNGLLQAQLDKHEEILRVTGDHKDITQRLMHNMS